MDNDLENKVKRGRKAELLYEIFVTSGFELDVPNLLLALAYGLVVRFHFFLQFLFFHYWSERTAY